MDTSGIPTDGPETTLGQAARRLKLRYSRTHVARAVAAHPQPNSLLALVSVASDLGIKVTAGMTEESALKDLDRPAIVHFDGAEGGGFGVLEGVTPDGFQIWDRVSGLHLIRRDVFMKYWSGIVALFERAEDEGPPEQNHLRNRVTELVFSGYEPPAVVGNRAALPLRAVFGALVVGLLAIGVAALPSEDRLAAAAVMLLTALGLMVTVIAAVSIGAQDGALSERICARGRFVDCHSVLSSRYSRVFGISLTDIGIAFFGSLLLLMATTSIAEGAVVWTAVSFTYVASLPLSLALIGVQVAMRQLCTLCLAVHTVNLSSAALCWIWLRPGEWTLDAAASSLLLLALFFCLLLFLVVPYFRKNQGLRTLTSRHRRISSSPFASLADLSTEEPAAFSPTDCAVALDGPRANHDLVVFVHPSCGKCSPVLQQVSAVAQTGLVNVYLGLAPKDPKESDRLASSVVVAVGLSQGSARLIEAYTAAKKCLRSMMTGDPLAVMAEELAVPRGSIEGMLEEARRRTDAAEGLMDLNAEGTPALFFNSRYFRGELTHLLLLLENHPELLPARGIQDGSTREAGVSPS